MDFPILLFEFIIFARLTHTPEAFKQQYDTFG